MLMIRSEQMAAFEDALLTPLLELIIAQLREDNVPAFDDVGEEEVRRWIRRGFARAKSYGIDTERGLYRFINVMIALGPDFDNDPELPWVRNILESSDLKASKKLDLLFVETCRWLESERRP